MFLDRCITVSNSNLQKNLRKRKIYFVPFFGLLSIEMRQSLMYFTLITFDMCMMLMPLLISTVSTTLTVLPPPTVHCKQMTVSGKHLAVVKGMST